MVFTSFAQVKAHIHTYLKSLAENLLNKEDHTELYLLFVNCFQVTELCWWSILTLLPPDSLQNIYAYSPIKGHAFTSSPSGRSAVLRSEGREAEPRAAKRSRYQIPEPGRQETDPRQTGRPGGVPAHHGQAEDVPERRCPPAGVSRSSRCVTRLVAAAMT